MARATQQASIDFAAKRMKYDKICVLPSKFPNKICVLFCVSFLCFEIHAVADVLLFCRSLDAKQPYGLTTFGF